MVSFSRIRADGLAGHRLAGVRSGWLGLLVMLWVAGGCASPQRLPGVAAGAEVVVENHTDRTWRVAFSPADRQNAAGQSPAGEVAWLPVGPREIRRVKLAGGTYRVWRELVGAEGILESAALPATEAELSFRSGQTYTWPLGTLLSNEEGSP